MDLATALLAAALASHPAAVTAQPGQTLSGLALDYCGTAADYPGLAAASGVANPDRIGAGQRIIIRCSAAGPRSRWRPALAGAYAARHATAAAAGDCDGDDGCHSAGYPARHATAAAAATAGGYYGNIAPGSGPGGAFGACVVARESGGRSQVMNASGHYGLYQFSAPTWAAYGGNPATFGHATVAEQEAVFARALAAGGQSNWSLYDGC